MQDVVPKMWYIFVKGVGDWLGKGLGLGTSFRYINLLLSIFKVNF